MRIIHLDMDGVLADFNKGFKIASGKFPQEFSSTKEFWKEAVKYQFLYRDLPPLHYAYDMVHQIFSIIKDKNISVEILTAIPLLQSFPYAAEHKEQWVIEHFPTRKMKFKVGPYAVDKQKHAKPNDILIDDKLRNIEQWESVGGIGIYHTHPYNTIQELKVLI